MCEPRESVIDVVDPAMVMLTRDIFEIQIEIAASFFTGFFGPAALSAFWLQQTVFSPDRTGTAARHVIASPAVGKMVTDQAPGIFWLWDKQPNLESSNVNGVNNKSLATWDFAFTSLK